MSFDKLVDLCKKVDGKLKDNFCVINRKEQQIVISMFTPFTEDTPKAHMDEQDLDNILNLASKQKHQNLHFYNKQFLNNTLFYGAQAFSGDFPKKEYYGQDFLINKEGRIKFEN